MKTILSLKTHINIVAIALSLAITTSSCDSGNAQSMVSVSAGPEEKVAIEHMAYNPATLTIEKGTKVTWTNTQGLVPHSVTSDTNGLFDSGSMHKDDTFSYTFNNSGTFTYHCTHHKKMHGTVIVK